MDIHRCRFISYSCSAINTLSFSHTPSKTSKPVPKTLRLAIGRANGDIELWNPLKGEWTQESVIRGGKGRSIEGLSWVQDPEDFDRRGYKTPGRLRLFSTGYSDVVTEWDLATGKALRHASGNHGEIWCMAAQPKTEVSQKPDDMDDDDYKSLERDSQIQHLAVGCADGSIVLLSTAEDDLRFLKVVARPGKKKTRVLSLTWQNRYTVIAGHADSTIRIYDIRGGQQIRSMTLGGGSKDGPKETLVWSVKCLHDGTIVSGDSNGVVSFWDGKLYALIQRIEGHTADVLDIAVSVDGQQVFSGGMDRRTTLYQKSKVGQSQKSTRWAKSSHSRLHKNDVKAMAIFEAKNLSVLVSGGLDRSPIVVPVGSFGREYHRRLSCLQQHPIVKSAASERFLVSWWDLELRIWSITTQYGNFDSDNILHGASGNKLLTKIMLQGDEHINSATISANGHWLFVSTIRQLRCFRLSMAHGGMKVRQCSLPDNTSNTATKSIDLSPDSRWLVLVTPEDKVKLLRLVEAHSSTRDPNVQQKITNLRRLPREPLPQVPHNGSLGRYDRSINRTAFSSDSKILAVSDLSGYIDTWLLEGREDLTQDLNTTPDPESSDSDSDSSSFKTKPTLIFGQQWIRNPSGAHLPKLPRTPQVLSFRPPIASTSPPASDAITLHPTRHTPHPHSHALPTGEARLLVITPNNSITEYDVLSGRLSDWSRRNPASLFPTEYRNLRDPAKGVVWDISSTSERVWVYGVSWLWMFDLSRDFPSLSDLPNGNNDMANGAAEPPSKRKRLADIGGDGEAPKQDKREKGSGAGSKRRARDMDGGIGRTIQKTQGTDIANRKIIAFDRVQPSSFDDDESSDNDDMVPSKALLALRRGPHPEQVEVDTADEMQIDGAGDTKTEKPMHWHTFKYRPILGIVPIGDVREREGREGRGVEVAVVERPLWDMDGPGSHLGDQEWGD